MPHEKTASTIRQRPQNPNAARRLVVYTLPLAESGHLPRLRKLRPPEKGATMSNPTTHNTTDGKWRDPYLIGAIARTQAMKLELESDRAGQLYLMTEILTALHRQAEALEAIEDTLYGAILSTRHPLTQTSHERKPFDNPDDPR